MFKAKEMVAWQNFCSLINIDEITLQKNSVGLLPNIKLVAGYWLQWKDVTKNGRNSKSKKNSRSSEVAPTKDADDDFTRLTSAFGRPTMDKQQTRREGKLEDPAPQS